MAVETIIKTTILFQILSALGRISAGFSQYSQVYVKVSAVHESLGSAC